MTTVEFNRRVLAFLASAGMPAWLEGHVPDGQQLPYMVYSADCGGFGEAGRLAVTSWFGGDDAAQQRAAFAEALERLLPRSGVKLIGEGGMVTIRRDGKSFMEMTADDGDPRVIGIRMNAVVRTYG